MILVAPLEPRQSALKFWWVALGLLFACFPFALAADDGSSDRSRFGQRVAGLYLAVDPDGSHVFSIDADGQFTYMESPQFTGFSGGPAFSNELGTWRRVGRRSLIATSLHLGYWQDGSAFTGTTVLRRTFEFAPGFRSLKVTCTGTAYAPGVDPFDPQAQSTSSFVCPERGFRRIPAGS
ncbi:MAG: hypothetical protein OSB70_19050 [Myxococcota bacterium]|nr:hypothetical protein [Myxococcota bacterium]